ncbi:MAG: hypothetical protein EZS28_020210 [Streblomastix strix]|uniref:Uncharacterized protein n=1 Tax=Streblomastix strix TaxID=222440 RepID=A0A5J4VP06_9EUKA|nr:MAG: hypothetical protein EZS28_020210 [Streblomastix strix]
MIPLSQTSTIIQSSEKSLSLKAALLLQLKKHADNPRHSFEISYMNDYPTYIWAYDLSLHPELLMATYPLKPNTQLNNSVVKPYKTVSDLDQSLMYLQNESFAQSMDVLKFTDSVYASFLPKEEFIHSAELHIAYSIFLQDFRPAMQLKLLAQLQKAYEYFSGWISRWVVYRLMRQAEEWMESGKGINQKQNGISESGGSLNARLAQEQYNTLLIAHSENPNILRQYSVLMRDNHLMEERNKADLLKNEDELEQNNDIWDVDADQSNQQQQEGEQNQNEGQDVINQTEGGKTLQKSDSLTDGNTLNNKSQIKSASQSASGAIRAGSQKNEILKKLQTKQIRQSKALILIFSFIFISLGLLIELFIFSYIFISTNFMNVVDGGRAFRRAIVVAELMNTSLDYSRYYMFEILMVDQDGGTELDAVYGEATGVRYQLLIDLNQEYHQLYE